MEKLWRSSIRCMTRSLSLLFLLVAGISALPVYAAGTILVGQQQLASTIDSNAAGVAEAFRATASASGTVTSLSAYVDASSTGTKLVLGLYSDKNGTPGNLLGQGSLTSPTKGAWNTVTVPNISVIAGSVYWIAILAPPNSGTLKYLASGSNGSRSETSRQTTLTTLPATWSTGKAWSSSPVSAYGSAAAATVPILSVSPSSLIFTAVAGGQNPPFASLSVNNTGAGTLNFTGSTNTTWLSVSPTSGAAPPIQTLQVNAALGTLPAGVYNGNVTITASGAQGSPATVPVTFNVTSPTPPPSSGSDWLTYGHDPQRTGNAAGESVITPQNAGTLGLKWTANLNGKVTAQPLFVSAAQVNGQTRDVVIAATAANSIYALDAATGTTLWVRNFGSPSGSSAIGNFGITGTPVIDRSGGRIFAVSDDGNLRTVSLSNGTEASPAIPVVVDSLTQPVLSNTATNKVWGGLNLVGNNLYITTASDGDDTNPWWGRIVRVDVSGTAPVLAGWFKVVPSINIPNGGGGIWGYGGIAADSLGRVIAATAADSKPWSSTVPEGYTPYAGRMVALAGDLGYSSSQSWGNPLGSYEPPHPSPCPGAPGVCDMDFGATPIVFQPPGCQKPLTAAVNKDGHIYVLPVDDLAASATTSLQALALNIAYDGPGAGGLTGIPAYWPTGNMLFVTDGGPGINGINAGVVGLTVNCNSASNYLQVAWSDFLAAANDQPPSPPTVADGVVFVGSGVNGSVHAYDATSGTELWNSGSTSGASFAAPMVANGTLYVASWNGFGSSATGTVRAFAPGGAPPPSPPASGVILGDQTIESQPDSNALGSAEAFQTTASASGTVNSLWIYIDAPSTASTLTAGIYTDSGSAPPHPAQLIAQGTSTTLTAGAWNKISIPGAAVSAGTRYWIAILGTQSGTLGFRDASTGGCASETSSLSNLTSLPTNWSTGTSWPNTCLLSAYGSTNP